MLPLRLLCDLAVSHTGMYPSEHKFDEQTHVPRLSFFVVYLEGLEGVCAKVRICEGQKTTSSISL